MVLTLAQRIDARLAVFATERTIERIWQRDHTVWKLDPTEIVDRLGWLDVAAEMRALLPELEAFARGVAAEGFRHLLLLGMGGSSLGPEVLFETFGAAPGMPALIVLDSTHPRQIRETEAKLDLARTLVVVASKSGTTIETASHLEYFWSRIGQGGQFVAITDPGSALARIGRERGFRRVFENRPDIGGRYSVLSFFGMVPAALIGRDKCTLVLPSSMAKLGWWIEQLVAESTGKEGRGILPLEGEALQPPTAYGADRIFVAYEESAALRALEAAGHPVVRLAEGGIGGEFFRWEFATAVAGAVLDIQPFDQPNVQEAKDAAGIVLDGGTPDVAPMALRALLASVEPGDYIAVNAFIARNDTNSARLAAVRGALAERFGVAVTVGFGPRFLHSTGQLHKGGPASGAFIEIVDDAGVDIAIPGKPYTFGELVRAQALGDLAALLGRGLRASRLTLEELEAAI